MMNELEISIASYLLSCEANNTKKTLRWKQLTLRSVFRYLTENYNIISLSDITIDMLNAVVVHEKTRGLELITIRKKIDLILDILKYHEIDFPFHKVKKLKVKRKMRDRLTDAQIIQVFQYLNEITEEDGNNIVYKTLFYFLLDSGARIDETLHIELSNIDFDNNCIKLSEEIKNMKERYIYFTNFSKPYLVKLYDLAMTNYLFNNLRLHRRLDYDSDVQYFYRKLRKELGLQGITAHKLRHTFASISIENGMNILTLQMVMGHDSLKSTMGYLHGNKMIIKREYDKYSPLSNIELSEQIKKQD